MQNILSRIVKYGICALVFLLPLFWLPFSFEVFEYSKQYLLFFLISLAFFAWLAKQIFYDKEIRFKQSPIDYFVLGFLFIAVLSAIFSVDKSSSLFGFYGRFSNSLIGLLSLGALYFLITNTVEARKPLAEDQKPKTKNQTDSQAPKPITINGLLNLFLYSVGGVVFMSYFSVFGVWAKISGFFSFLPPLMLQKIFNPVAGSFEGLAVFLSIAAVLLAGLLLNKTKNIFYWLLLPASLGLMAMADFSPAWIILLLTMSLLVAVSLIKRIFKENVNQLLIPIFLLIITAVFMVFEPLKTNLPKEQVLSQSVSWQIALKSATDDVKSVFLGSGWGTFHYDFAKHKPQSFNQDWTWQIRFDRPGSHLSELLGTIGFPGFLAYLALAGFTLLISWFFISRQFPGLPLIMVFAALLAGQLVYYQNTVLSFVFWLVLGLLAVSWKKTTEVAEEKKFSFKTFPELSLFFLTLTIILGVVMLSFYFYGVKYYLADIHYYKALLTIGEPRVKSLERAVALNSGLPQYRTALARAYLSEALSGTQKTAAEQDAAKIQLLVAKAIEQGGAATAIQPNQVANWETLAVIYREIRGIAAGAAEWGITSFERAIELEPTNPVLYTELGKLYFGLGNKEKARESFNKALEEKSDYVTATIQLALLLEQDNILNEAVAKLENLVQSNPFNIEARFQLGRLYFNNRRLNESIEQFKVIVALVPNHSNAHYSLGIAYADSGQRQLAIQEFEKVLELNPGNPDVMKKLKDLRGK